MPGEFWEENDRNFHGKTLLTPNRGPPPAIGKKIVDILLLTIGEKIPKYGFLGLHVGGPNDPISMKLGLLTWLNNNPMFPSVPPGVVISQVSRNP